MSKEIKVPVHTPDVPVEGELEGGLVVAVGAGMGPLPTVGQHVVLVALVSVPADDHFGTDRACDWGA